MIFFVLGLILFFGIHHNRQLVPGLRGAMHDRIGENRWKGLYALISFVGIGLIILGWVQARPDVPDVYEVPSWGRHATLSLVYIGLVFIIAANTPVGRIKSTLQHPMLIGIIIWSIAHLLANADLLSVLLFGAFILSAIVLIIAAVMRGEAKPKFTSYRGDFAALAAAAIFYYVFAFWLHGPLIGAYPF